MSETALQVIEEEEPETPAEEPETPPEPDPREAELAALRAENQRLLAARDQMFEQALVARQAPTPAAPPPQAPDFSNMPDPVQDPVGYAREHWSRVEAFRIAREAAAPPPVESEDDFMAAVYAVDPTLKDHPDLAYAGARDYLREIKATGGDPAAVIARNSPTRHRALERIVDKAKMKIEKYKAPAPLPTPRTAGTGGGSLPSGVSAAKPTPKYPSSVDVMKGIQKKRGLY